MDVSGSNKIKASQQQVFQALLNPEILKNSVPGCESAEFVDFPTGRQLKMMVSPDLPGLKGPYTIYLQTGEVVAPSHVVLIAEPTSSLGSIKATCAIDLSEVADGTDLSYNAHAEMTGKIAAIPDMILKGTVKGALDRFFKNFEKQVSSIPA
jgi:carbon monoxide dehydrogenase subunit G